MLKHGENSLFDQFIDEDREINPTAWILDELIKYHPQIQLEEVADGNHSIALNYQNRLSIYITANGKVECQLHPVSFYPQSKIEELEQITEQLRINNEITKRVVFTLGLECRIRRTDSPDLLYAFPFQVDDLGGQRQYVKYMILELIRLTDSNA